MDQKKCLFYSSCLTIKTFKKTKSKFEDKITKIVLIIFHTYVDISLPICCKMFKVYFTVLERYTLWS